MSDFRRRMMLAAATANSTSAGEITLVDADSGETIGHVSRAADITQIANALDYSGSDFVISKTRKFSYTGMIGYSFAGWFSSTESLTSKDDANAYKVTSLTDAPEVIYAHWVKMAYLETTIAYVTGDATASRILSIWTTPAQIFETYGVLSKNIDQGTVGGNDLVLDGDGVRNHTGNPTLLVTDPPFSTSNSKTANDFNGNLGGYAYNGTNGYCVNCPWSGIRVGRTWYVRPYYTTKDGTTVYGDMRSKTLLANTTDTGLTEATTNPVTPPTVDI